MFGYSHCLLNESINKHCLKTYHKVKRGDGITKERVIGSEVVMIREAKWKEKQRGTFPFTKVNSKSPEVTWLLHGEHASSRAGTSRGVPASLSGHEY